MEQASSGHQTIMEELVPNLKFWLMQLWNSNLLRFVYLSKALLVFIWNVFLNFWNQGIKQGKNISEEVV